MIDIPYALKRYIEKEQNHAGEANCTEFKPTYQAELDRIESDAKRQYESGQELLARVSAEDLSRGKKLFLHRGGSEYEATELVRMFIDKKFVVVPRYVGAVEEAHLLHELLR